MPVEVLKVPITLDRADLVDAWFFGGQEPERSFVVETLNPSPDISDLDIKFPWYAKRPFPQVLLVTQGTFNRRVVLDADDMLKGKIRIVEKATDVHRLALSRLLSPFETSIDQVDQEEKEQDHAKKPDIIDQVQECLTKAFANKEIVSKIPQDGFTNVVILGVPHDLYGGLTFVSSGSTIEKAIENIRQTEIVGDYDEGFVLYFWDGDILVGHLSIAFAETK